MLISDTHLHSFFSSDSEASMEEMVLGGITRVFAPSVSRNTTITTSL